MITQFKSSKCNLSDMYDSFVLLMMYSLVFRQPLLNAHDVEFIPYINLKEMFNYFVLGPIAFVSLGVFVGVIAQSIIEMVLTIIDLNKPIAFVGVETITYKKAKRYHIYSIDKSNPFLFGSKTIELRE